MDDNKPKGYSKITEIEIANFMSIKHAKLIFDESGIINLKGYNDSGKSATLYAIVTCLTNLWSSKQAKFITHDQDFFRVKITFNDGVSILRDKYINGQSLYEMYKDGKVVFSTKEGKSLSKVTDVPQIIQDYLGLCMLDHGCLNFQSRKDPLFLVDTTGGENYRDLHEVLKIEQISRANAMVNSDRNHLGSVITELESQIQDKELKLADSKDITEELILAMSDREDYANSLEAQLNQIEDVEYILSDLSELGYLPELSQVSSSELEDIEELSQSLDSLESLKLCPVVEKVSSGQLSACMQLENLVAELEEYSKVEIPSIPSINPSGTKKLGSLADIASVYNDLLVCSKEFSAVKHEIKSVQKEIKLCVEKARRAGYVFAKCNNCGSYMNVKV